MIYKPHEYQQKGIDEIIEKFQHHNRLLYQLDTGGGKTMVFSFLSKYWRDHKREKVLILCHREELIAQAAETLTRIGLTFETIVPNKKYLNHHADVYIAMIETLDRRLKKHRNYLPDIGLLIADEAHVMVFQKVYDHFKESKILGVTATPVLLGRDTFFRCNVCDTEHLENTMCCNNETMEWSRPKRISSVYEDIVVGPKIDYLIEFGQLVKEINFVRNAAFIDELKTDSSGEFSKESQAKVFGDVDSIFNVVANYEELLKGKRTIVFNNSSKTNKLVHDQFKEKGYNVKLYDSVNDTQESRKSIVKWFKETEDAILCNVAVFVAGFDAKEVQGIILNVATTSLSKYLQMVGRGGRSSSDIYKDHFICIDGGGNIERFGEWSDPNRDWRDIFENGIGKEKPKREDIEFIKVCSNCGYYMGRTELSCPECGSQPPVKVKREDLESDDIAVALSDIPKPNAEKIYRYTISKGENIHFAHKILINQILDLFILHQVPKELYLSTLKNGKFNRKISELIRSCYFVLLEKKDIHTGQHRTIQYLAERCGRKIATYYSAK